VTRWLLTASLALWPLGAAAQPRPDLLDIAVGGRWTAPASPRVVPATLTTPTGGALALFTTETNLMARRAVEARVGVRLSRVFHAELVVSFGEARLRTRITGDFEGASGIDVSESVRQLSVGGSLLAELEPLRVGRLVPFLAVGAGFLHEGRSFVENGHTFDAGGGLNYTLRTGTGWTGRRTVVGIRGDLRAVVRTGGSGLSGGAHTALSTGGSLFFRF
jgi:hypothetical protein